MKEPLIVFTLAAALGAALGLALCGAPKRLRRGKRKPRASAGEGNGMMKAETTKRVIWACLLNGIAWVWCSYILAYMDKVQIAESLSQVAVTEIIGVVLAYCIKSAVENLSKNNRWPDKGGAPGEKPEEPEPPGEG